jgi:DNA-binding MarR family transcriptional regulator
MKRTESHPSRRSTREQHAHLAVGVHVRIAKCCNLLMRAARQSVASRSDLTLPQFDVLVELARADRRGFTFRELSGHLLVTSGNLTGVVDRLEAQGLVCRDPVQSDRRMIRVRLSGKGLALTRGLLPHLAADLERVLGFLPKETLIHLTELLDDLRHGLTDLGAVPLRARPAPVARPPRTQTWRKSRYAVTNREAPLPDSTTS